VLGNPGFQLALVEEPGLLWDEDLDLHPGAVIAAVRSPRCPEGLARQALGEVACDLEFVENPAFAPSLRREVLLQLPLLGDGKRSGNVIDLGPLAAALSSAELDLLARAGLRSPAAARRPWQKLPFARETAAPLAAADLAMTEEELVELAGLGLIGLELALRHPACPPARLRERYEQAEISWYGDAALEDHHPESPERRAQHRASPFAHARALAGG
jgi:hypothetical protein